MVLIQPRGGEIKIICKHRKYRETISLNLFVLFSAQDAGGEGCWSDSHAGGGNATRQGGTLRTRLQLCSHCPLQVHGLLPGQTVEIAANFSTSITTFCIVFSLSPRESMKMSPGRRRCWRPRVQWAWPRVSGGREIYLSCLQFGYTLNFTDYFRSQFLEY